MSIKAETGFSLKDQLFNGRTVTELATAIARVHKPFPEQSFITAAAKAFPQLELKQRIDYLVDLLNDCLPRSYETALKILLRSLPPPLDPTLSDDDFGHFIWAVPGEFVARNGCNENHLELSLDFLRQATQRFSSELAIRPFLAKFPQQTLRLVHNFAVDQNYHVRRLASEGIRPLLPWAMRVVLPQRQVIEVLNKLYRDPTRYVTRSVANTLNDLSKSDPSHVLKTLKRWHKSPHPAASEMAWLTRHGLRTLVKTNNLEALELLGYPSQPAYSLADLSCSRVVKVGQALTWRCSLTSAASQRLKIFLCVHFRRKDGGHKAKMFSVKELTMAAGETVNIDKNLMFRPMTTRTLYAGEHFVELVVNGSTGTRRSFKLTA